MIPGRPSKKYTHLRAIFFLIFVRRTNSSLRLNKLFPLAPRLFSFPYLFLYSTLSFPLYFPGETIKFSGL